MVNVTRTLDLAPVIASTKLRFGSDFGYFLDSTMVRFWFYHQGAEQAVRTAFKNIPGGRLLDVAQMKHFGIAGCDRRNGELYFLADPGVLLFPNFFQGDGEPIKGMHGYDPDCADNLGIFVLHRADRPDLNGRNLGKVNPHQIFALLKQLAGLPGTGSELSLSSQPAPAKNRFTPQPNPAAEATIQQHLETIIKTVGQRIGAYEAIVLTGSFGRGEGGVYQDDSSAWRPVNDYDIFVVSPKNCGGELKELSETLVKELGLDYLDLGWTDGKWANWPSTVANYDLKYGSRVIAGDLTILNRLPAFASADLPMYEAAKLLLNRTAGLLTGLRGEMLGGGGLNADQRRYLSNQIAKAQMALGDSYLIRWGGYDASYRLRCERFAALAPGAGLSNEVIEQVVQGYQFKLKPDYSLYTQPLETINRLRPHLETAVIATVNQMSAGRTTDLASAMSLYLATMSEDRGWVRSDNAFFSSQPALQNLFLSQVPPAATVSVRHLVYSALPKLLAAAFVTTGADELLEATRRILSAQLKLPEKKGAHPTAWESLRATTITAWFAVHH
jgi:hypothetical protein